MSHVGHNHADHCHHQDSLEEDCHSHKLDYFYWLSLGLVTIAYGAHLAWTGHGISWLEHFNHQVFELVNSMLWAIAVSIVAVGFLNQIPREMVTNYFSGGTHAGGLVKATLAGTLFDLCSHGILLLGMKLYERGASLGQTMAFLIASPWNSFSLTLILYTLVGGNLTLAFVVLSMVIAIITGWIFDFLVKRKILPENPHANRLRPSGPPKIRFEWSWAYLMEILKSGFKDSQMILKWIFIGTLLSALVSAFVPPEVFAEYFGKSVKGLLFTLAAATGLEVCSEGSVPLAADLVRVAQAPGNAFIFLMAGVATDVTEILAIRETMKSWKIAFFLPLLTVPQIIFWGILINVGIF